MKLTKKNISIIAVLFSVICLFFQNSSLGISTLPLDISTLYIPEHYGKIYESFTGSSDKMIIHIQDSHCNYLAQQNIVKILQTLIDHYEVKLVAVEGTKGDINTSVFATYPDEETKQNVADYFMKIGQITGPEYVSISTQKEFFLIGIEKENLYISNVLAFRSALEENKKVEQYLELFKEGFKILNSKIYSPELLDFSNTQLEYEREKIPLSAYLKYLFKTAEKQHISLENYPNFKLLLESNQLEEKIDFQKVDKERTLVLAALGADLKDKELAKLINLSLQFKDRKISYLKYYQYLKEKLSHQDLIQDKAPNFLSYTNYIKIFNKINKAQVAAEQNLLTKELLSNLSLSKKQKNLFSLNANYHILEDLFHIKMERSKYLYYKQNKPLFQSHIFKDFINDEMTQYNPSFLISPYSKIIDQQTRAVENFYDIALSRENNFTEQLLYEMNRRNIKIAILITGGFHTSGITAQLKQQKISHLVISPLSDTTQQAEIDQTYTTLLSEKKLPFQRFLDKNPLPEAVPGVIGFNSLPTTKALVFNFKDRKNNLKAQRANVLAFDSLFKKLVEKDQQNAFTSDYVSKLLSISIGQAERLDDLLDRWQQNLIKKSEVKKRFLEELQITDKTLIDDLLNSLTDAQTTLTNLRRQIGINQTADQKIFAGLNEGEQFIPVTFKEAETNLLYHTFPKGKKRILPESLLIDSRSDTLESISMNDFLSFIGSPKNLETFFGDTLQTQNLQEQLTVIRDRWGLSDEQVKEFFTSITSYLEDSLGINQERQFAIDINSLLEGTNGETILDAYRKNKETRLLLISETMEDAEMRKALQKKLEKLGYPEDEVEKLIKRTGTITKNTFQSTVASKAFQGKKITGFIISESSETIKDSLQKAGECNFLISATESDLALLLQMLNRVAPLGININQFKTNASLIKELQREFNITQDDLLALFDKPFPKNIKATTLFNNLQFSKVAVARAA